MKTYINNFDFLRFVFALFVVITHSYALSGTPESAEWIWQITGGQLSFSQIGLCGFFVISGYFIFTSLQRASSLKIYFKNRILRIFPGLLGVLCVTLLLIPFLHLQGFKIFTQWDYYTYVPRNMSLYGFQSIVKGVFDTNNYHAINGSLWTIRYEFSLYFILAFLFYFKKHPWINHVLLAFSFIVMYVVYNFFFEQVAAMQLFYLQGYHFFNLGTFFVVGSLLASLQFEKKNSIVLLCISLTVLILSIYFEVYNSVKHIVFPVVILSLGFIPLRYLSIFGKYGDSSYGIYIYSFPVQQVLVYFFKPKVYSLMMWSLLISIILGFLSWYFIEKKALNLKNKNKKILTVSIK